MDRLKDKVAVIIGAGQSPGEEMGNGRATTIRFAQEGARILAVDLNPDSAQQSLDMTKVDNLDAKVPQRTLDWLLEARSAWRRVGAAAERRRDASPAFAS